jgi:putative ABC transport system ATP-binding protein
MSDLAILARDLRKAFEHGRIPAVNGIDLEIRRGEFVAIMGPSGSGKSTLLNLIGALDKPDSGELVVAGENLNQRKDFSQFRAKQIGFVFQLHNLIPTLSAVENVRIPMFEAKISGRQAIEKARELLRLVTLEERMTSTPTKLSGGERQRVAVARALANDPEIILADEPTGNVDSKTEEKILELLKDINQRRGTTLVLVTHDQRVANTADRVIHILDGKVVSSNLGVVPTL